MAKFKIGDRVRMVEHHEDSKPIAIGWLGTVVAENGSRIGVSWDEFKSGHNCDVDMSMWGRNPNSGRWMTIGCLELVDDEGSPFEELAAKPKPTFKAGDRVVLVKHSCDSKQKLKIGWQGTVKKISDFSVGVSWDDLKSGHNLGGAIDGMSGWSVEKDAVQLVIESPAAELVEMGEAIVDAITGGSKPKTKPEETSSELKTCCANCQEWYPMEGCEHGFCNSWHNFCTKNEFCSRIKMCG